MVVGVVVVGSVSVVMKLLLMWFCNCRWLLYSLVVCLMMFRFRLLLVVLLWVGLLCRNGCLSCDSKVLGMFVL